MAARTAAAPAMSHFMSTMPSVGLSDRPPLSKVTPLPTRPSVLPAAPLEVPQRDQPGRAIRTLGHRQERAHPFLLELLLVEDLAIEAGLLGDGGGSGGERLRVKIAGRHVDQFAGQADRLRLDLGPPHRPRSGRAGGGRTHEPDLLRSEAIDLALVQPGPDATLHEADRHEPGHGPARPPPGSLLRERPGPDADRISSK